jgi:hypothetical protein
LCRFGGQAVSLGINYTHKEEFAAAGYTPYLVNGTEYGEVRQYGNFSFARVYEVSVLFKFFQNDHSNSYPKSGHEVPYYQPVAALELFKRVLLHLDVADGTVQITGNYSTTGNATATHTNSYVPLPSTSSSASAAASAAPHQPVIPRKL